jgi:hypothetical protein
MSAPSGRITLGAGPPGTQCTRHARAPRTILCRVRGGSVNKAYCPAFTRTVPEKAAYKNAANLQRLLKVLELAGELQSTQAYTLAASLVYDGQQQLKSGNAATDTWSDEVTSLAAEAAWLGGRPVARTQQLGTGRPPTSVVASAAAAAVAGAGCV